MTIKVETKRYLNFINGEWTPSVTSEVERSMNPADKNDVIGLVQKSTKEDLNNAVKAAKLAKDAWRKLSASQRGEYLYKAASILEKRINDIAECATREMGKTLAESKGETARGIAILKYYAGEGMRKVGDVIPSTDPSALMFTTRVPLGVVGVITPWNFPIAIPIWKMAPALVYGNTIVIKPATETAVTCAKIIECFEEAGFPPGVVNMLTGPGSVVGQGIADHEDVNGITFTGSNGVGKQIGQSALARGAKYQLEMGGKNPVIVAADADLQLAVNAVIDGAFRSTGQKCTATSRVIVLSDVYQEFKKALVEKTKEITIGNGLDRDTWMGPCASEGQLNTVLSYINKGLEEGATLLIGGKRAEKGTLGNGYYVEPTIFENCSQDMAIVQEEIFGPVIALLKAESVEEALQIANNVEYGLSASIFTTNIQHFLSFIQDMEAGLIRINAESAGVELQAPFGGMKNSSSHSREQGEAAKEFFTSIKTVFVK
ncbi:alpha-ketoglutaric semialdehyde dehydrogenase GucD [Metabacillus sediminilitoris]|uniref:Aldehyde dehydrogenase family protein n=1 Tax=Metabacillus sediminilitoris TaxID=2567941 RepID=A0A4S4BXY1_9BACI|nr:alpha-ketoglutaric semialdehyde dehydrogenase GucD [Metabacillus sediminilitoris]QGQ44375.1 aldehyde dehydrogenase family protein [Metabacillus sediminilitoris]THF79999.1 aldehyde dehydrogenase family protein [Metabacillus sediminilitoris]